MRQVRTFCDLCNKEAINERVEAYSSWFEIKNDHGTKYASSVGCLRYALNIEVCGDCFKLFQNAVEAVVIDFQDRERDALREG